MPEKADLPAPTESAESGASIGAGEERSGGGHPRAVVATLCVLLLLWLAAFAAGGKVTAGPSDTGLGGDFATFYTASVMRAHGEDPYDRLALYRAERRIFRTQRLPPPKYEAYIRAGNPPLLYWAMGPLTRLSFRSAAWLWVAAMYVVCALSVIVLLAALGWRRRVLAVAIFLPMPQTVLAAYYGNVDPLVLAGLCLGVFLVRRRPMVAGAVLCMAWIKPQYALPLAALVILFLAERRARVVAGFTGVSAALLALTLSTTGLDSVERWGGSLAGLSSHTGLQPEIVSLSGLYVYGASSTVSAIVEGLTLALALGITAWWWIACHKAGGSRPEDVGTDLNRHLLASGWLWVLWLLAAPLAHFHYEIVLVPAVLALVGRDGADVGKKGPATVLVVLLLSVLLFPTQRGHADFQSLTLLPVLAICYVAARRAVTWRAAYGSAPA